MQKTNNLYKFLLLLNIFYGTDKKVKMSCTIAITVQNNMYAK